MIAKVYSAIPYGYEGRLIEVEGDSNKGLPAFNIVGMAAKTINESRERVRSALVNSGFTFPNRKITVNLAPAELPKDGAHLDLPIAISILTLSEQLLEKDLAGCLFAGELSLSGDIRPVRGIINIVETAQSAGFTSVCIPADNLSQASLIPDIKIIGLHNLHELLLHLKNQPFPTITSIKFEQEKYQTRTNKLSLPTSSKNLKHLTETNELTLLPPHHVVKNTETEKTTTTPFTWFTTTPSTSFTTTPSSSPPVITSTAATTPSVIPSPSSISSNSPPPVLLDHIHGQDLAKRALTIAIAGHHNLLISGPPGAGKTLLARAGANLLPTPSPTEQIAITKIHSLAGLTDTIVTSHPFRTPHHTASTSSIIGGGPHASPGEISLAHLGILFLDEFPEYPRNILEALRQPLEDHSITITRANYRSTYPANFMLIATMNPCPCGYLGDTTHECTCTNNQIEAYRKKLSGPLLDRFDLIINVQKTATTDLSPPTTTAKHNIVKNTITEVIELQHLRYNNSYNGSLSSHQVSTLLKLTPSARQLLATAAKKLDLSARSYFKIIKVARTIADLELVSTPGSDVSNSTPASLPTHNSNLESPPTTTSIPHSSSTTLATVSTPIDVPHITEALSLRHQLLQ